MTAVKDDLSNIAAESNDFRTLSNMCFALKVSDKDVFLMFKADILIAINMAAVRDDLPTFCYPCAPHWAGRLRTGQDAR
jgi:hypothetical protein